MSDRHRELRRAYKETPRAAGVFRVLDPASGASFVGSSADVPGMLNRQRFQLDLGGHPDTALQRAWDVAGGAGFVFEVLDELEPDDAPGRDVKADLRALEALWRERLAGE